MQEIGFIRKGHVQGVARVLGLWLDRNNAFNDLKGWFHGILRGEDYIKLSAHTWYGEVFSE